MEWSDLQGLPAVLGKLSAPQARHGDAFQPSSLIDRRAVQGKFVRNVVEGRAGNGRPA